MTLVESPAETRLFDESQFGTDTDWVTDPVSTGQAAERLAGNPALLQVWDGLVPLLDGGKHSEQFWQYVPETPLLRVPDEALPADLQGTDQQLYLSAEGYMPTGAYKIHGVMNALLGMLAEDDDIHEVVGASTGNHAAAVAVGATALGLRSVLYMPHGAIATKVENSESFGAEVRFESNLDAAFTQAEKYGNSAGKRFIHAYDKLQVVAGQGATAALLPRQMQRHGLDPNMRFDMYEPIGGGGVAAGNGVASAVFTPNRRLHVVQAQDAHTAIAELTGTRFRGNFNPAVDGAAVRTPGRLGMQVLSQPSMVQGTHVVGRGHIGEAMAVTARFTDLYEPAGALALAAALQDMRHNRGGSDVKIVHGTGINTTPAKVHEFASEAYALWVQTGGKLGLSSAEASKLVSHANLDARRAPTELEEHVLALAAARRAPRRFRGGARVVSGR